MIQSVRDLGSGCPGSDALNSSKPACIAIDPEFGGTREHSFALDAFDDGASDGLPTKRGPGRNPGGEHTRPHIRRSAHDLNSRARSGVDRAPS